MLGPGSWVGTREERITLVLWVIASVALLGWLDELEAALNRVSLLPGRTQLSLWGLLKGLVIVTAFLVVTSLIARARSSVTSCGLDPAGRVNPGRSLEVRLLPLAGPGHAAGDQRRRR